MGNFDFCKYVDVFYGNGETDRFFDDGLASKWFYLKAQCGNTVPHATLPFGKMSVGAYSGGYPCGYGTHYPNTCGGIRKLGDEMTVRGFSHIHHSGTGGIRYYYNYAITSPFFGEIENSFKLRRIENECACPGYYSVSLPDVKCELTVSGGVALHRYSFSRSGGRVSVDFMNDGLDKRFGDSYFGKVEDGNLEIIGNDEAVFSGIFSGIRLYFCVKAVTSPTSVGIFKDRKEISGESTATPDGADFFGAVFDFSSGEALLKVGYSTVSIECARDAVKCAPCDFDEAKKSAYDTWNRALSSIKIHTENEETLEKFYSNFYHTIVKPVDMTGESVMGVEGDTVTDFATFWDQYKTVLPLVYMCYPDMGEKVVRAIANISRTLGKISCSFSLSDVFSCEMQAKMIGILTLCDAYNMGVSGISSEIIDECIRRELSREDFKEFLETGYFERYTHIIDTADACLAASKITGDSELRARLLALNKCWKNAFSDDGIMSENSRYYEGDRYNYSFRLQGNMDERVELCGGRERFAELLDDFFGYDSESVTQLRDVEPWQKICALDYHRFEGFNNETDMESPYAYIFADRHDRLCEILKECTTRVFGLGRGALPGNNDSGGLSSLFMWNALGIFPASGRGEFLIGSPAVKGAEISLANGGVLKISTENYGSSPYVERVLLNGKPVTDYRISMSEIMKGGTLEILFK